MFTVIDTKRWFATSVVRASELKSDLRVYKFEKEVARSGAGAEDDEYGSFGEKRDPLRNIFGFISSSVQQSTTQAAADPSTEDLSIFRRVFRDGTAENFSFKSAIGFSGGCFLTYICYIFLIYSLNFTLRRATLICIGLGVVLSLGLAFSVRIRCTVLLCIPQLFSKRGRQALLAYAFILALSGPAKNTLHNVEVMSESLACGQEQLKKAESELMKCVHRPNAAAKQSLEAMLVKLEFAVKDYRGFIESFYKDCHAVKDLIRAEEWVYSIYVVCNEKMGTPYGRCTDLLFDASRNCRSISTSPIWVKACDVSRVQDDICATRNSRICYASDLPPAQAFARQRKQLEEFLREAMNVVSVKLETRHVYTQPNRTSTLHEEYQGMATEIRQKTDQFLQYFDVMSVIFGIFILVLFIKVIIYRYKFLTEDEYDNRFITSDFVDIDRTRAEFRMQTLLPLEPRERKKYIKVTSMRLVPYEKARLFSSFVFLIFATFKIIIHMLTDSSLYWMLSTMRKHGRMLLLSSVREHPQLVVTVNGTGIYAELLRSVVKTVKPYAVQQIMDPIPCLPDPISPDWNRYYQILTLVAICWLLAFCEPYGLRLRHIVMVTYHPDRARERAIWLYNRILTTRINFTKFARRQLRRKYKDLDEATFFRSSILKIKRPLKCLLCKERLKKDKYVKCPTKGCVGIYCQPCFATLQLCSICKDPAVYGDYSDFSEEKDSEEEDVRCSRCSSFAELRKPRLEEVSAKYEKPPAMPKFEISMDTIVDVEENDREGGAAATGEPVESPSILSRLVTQCMKAFTSKGSKSRAFEEEGDLQRRGDVVEAEEGKKRKVKAGKVAGRKKAASKTKDSEGRPSTESKKSSSTRKKRQGKFKWKLKERFNETKTTEPFKNVYHVDVTREKVPAAPKSQQDSETELWCAYLNEPEPEKATVRCANACDDSFDNCHLLRELYRRDWDEGINSETQKRLRACLTEKMSAVERWMNEPDREERRIECTDKETQTLSTESSGPHEGSKPVLVEHFRAERTGRDSSSASSSDYGGLQKDLNKVRKKCKKSVKFERRRKRSGRKRRTRNLDWESDTSPSAEAHAKKKKKVKKHDKKKKKSRRSKDGDSTFGGSGQRSLSHRVDVVKAKLARLFRRGAKKRRRRRRSAGSDGCGRLSGNATGSELSRKPDDLGVDRKMSQLSWAPDLISDLPSSKGGETSRDMLGINVAYFNYETEGERDDRG